MCWVVPPSHFCEYIVEGTRVSPATTKPIVGDCDVQMSHKKDPALLSTKHWLFDIGIVIMAYYNPHIFLKQRRFFHCSNGQDFTEKRRSTARNVNFWNPGTLKNDSSFGQKDRLGFGGLIETNVIDNVMNK